MSYQVLARKWRPSHFAQLVGQDHVKSALGNALNNNRLHHAYLFTGTRGVGKTTIARIFAKSLNCEQGVTATPCGQCSACVEIDAGNFVDLLEIDAASRTKVEDTRDLLDNVQYAPTMGRFKVYLIDEVHMLSKHSFNALLKTLEEPPAHVKFLLATTDPQKLPVTVLSRCLQFNLLALSPIQIEQHLAYVLSQENIAFEQAALTLLARAAKGSLRDSLSLTDQAIAQSNANITLDAVRTMLGFLDQSWAELLLKAILSQDASQLQHQLSALVQQQSNFAQVLDDMLSTLHLAALSQFSHTAAGFSNQQRFVQELADTLAPAQIQLYYQLLISGKKELPYAPDPLIGLEMALLRAMAFVPDTQDKAAVPNNRTHQDSPSQDSLSALAGASVNQVSEMPPVSYDSKAVSLSAGAQNAEPNAVATPSGVTISSNVTSESLLSKEAVTDASAYTNERNQPVEIPDERYQPSVSKSEPAQEESLSIDPVTARIMARRGVNIEGLLEPKKSERPKAPAATIVPEPKQVVHQDALNNALSQPDVRHDAPLNVEAFNEPLSNVENEEQDDVDMPSFDESASDALWQQYEYDMALQPETAPSLEHFDGEITEQNFSVRFAAQVDAWAARVETMDTGGLSRLFLLNAAMSLEGNTLSLTVAQSQQHLDNPLFREKLQKILQQSFNKNLDVNITYQPNVLNSPLSIQEKIVQERLVYVSKLMQQDENVLQIQQLFNAQLLENSIIVN